MQFQQDSACAHMTHNSVVIWMGCLVTGLYHGSWSACALDLTACDFYLWDNTKCPQKQSPHRGKH